MRTTSGCILAALIASACGSGEVAALIDITVSVEPGSIGVPVGGTQQFTAAVRGASDGSVVWSVLEGPKGGAISPDGLYTGPSAQGTFHVVAASNADGTKSASATVLVSESSAGVEITIDPPSAAIVPGETVRFTATVAGTSDRSVVWSTDGGSVDQSGLFTAPAAEGTFHVTATSHANPGKSASATVSVSKDKPGEISISVDPKTATVNAGSVFRFTAMIGGTTDTRVRWSIDCCGTVAPDGTVTAPRSAGTYRITAQSLADVSKTASATLTVVTSGSIAVAVDPPEVTLSPGSKQVFHAKVTGTSNTSVTWSVVESDGGSIDDQAIYTAPSTRLGIFHVAATSQADASKSAVATVSVAYDDLIDHGGPVAPTVRVFALWWGPPADFPGDMRPAMESLLSHLDGSSTLAIADQYLRGAKATIRFAGSLFDSSAPPAESTEGYLIDEATCRALDAAGVTPQAGDMVFVYTSNFPHMEPATGLFCASHGDVSCNGTRVLSAYMPNPQGSICVMRDRGCNSYSDATRLTGSFTVHELLETITDPFGKA